MTESQLQAPHPESFDRTQAILFREYGRGVQQMVNHMLETEDRQDRTRQAKAIIEVMRIVNAASASDHVDYYQKLWDHLYAMAGYELDVETPFKAPDREQANRRPEPLTPPNQGVRFRNYGQHFDILLKKVLETDDEEERKAGISFLGRLVKHFYAAYNKEPLNDESVVRALLEVSNGKIALNMDEVHETQMFAVRNIPAVHNFQREQQGNRQPQYSGQGQQQQQQRGQQQQQRGRNNRRRY